MTNKIDQWWVEGTAPVNLLTVGRINFSSDYAAVDQSTLNKTLNRKVLLEIINKHDRIKDFYNVGPVQKAAVEDFVEDFLKYISKS